MYNALFVMERWCDANPKIGFTHNFHNYLATFGQFYKRPFHTLHLDEANIIFGTRVETILEDYCSKYNINLVFFSLLGDSSLNPSIECIRRLKDGGIKLVFLWHDCGPGWAINTISELSDLGLHIGVDHSNYRHPIMKHPNFINYFVPQNNCLFFNGKKSIPSLFAGSSRYPDRQQYLSYLSQNYPSIMIRGGHREEGLSIDGYAKLMRSAEINVNFSSHPLGLSQCKGRVFEAMACGSLLLESANESTRELFVPGEDYVEFDSPGELVAKLDYFSYNEQERLKIATAGNKKYLENYTSDKFWEGIMNRL